ncbi:kinase-like domain-containing protein [Absidia repens]|uniref:non-specific serine/threonine protein kinase n=1 Tax=Absidia repens TaxID=90262 RepID=A0A1X2IBJ8_9FUNG|nr:kinase-like domain-containing protein [Absidia repens]
MGAVCCTPDELDFGKEVELAHFYLLRVIGKGAFGKVRIVQHRKTEREYALKYISKSRCIEQKATHNILSERKLLERIEHPLIVNMRYAFQDEEHLFLALDLMAGGSMRFLLDRYTSIKEIQVRFYIADLICALEYLHQRRIAHRDIKPDNILLDANGHAHLSDFNIATQFYPNKLQRFSRAGSLAYMSPEIVGKQGYTTFVDWWSLGVTMFELLFGKRPFTGKSSEQVTEAILNGKVTFPDNVSEVISQNCMDVLQGLLTKTPLDRYGCGPNGIDKLKNHAWFQGIDWQAMIQKTAIPPFKPNTNESNFDAVHELEELLLEEVPLRPHKKIVKTNSRQRQWMDEKFLPFDYTKTKNIKNHNNDDDDHPHHDMTTSTRSLTPFTSSTSLTPTLLTTTLSGTTDDTMLSTPPTTTTATLDGSATGNRLLRRMGNALDQYEQSKYKAQGYVLTPNGDEDDDDDFTTLSDAGKKL